MKVLSLMVWACLITLVVSFSAQAADGLVLWNKLGSEVEVLNRDIGPSFEIREDGGDVLFLDDAVFGNAMATTGGTASTGPAGGYLAMNPDDFFPADKTRGTVEFWVQKQVRKFTPYESPLVTFFGRQRYATGYFSITAFWYDEDPNLLHFSVYDGQWIDAADSGWESIPVGQWVHVAFVWDGAGIGGGPDDLRIYRDGELVASHQGRFSQVVPFCCVGYSCGESYCSSGGYEVRVLANHEGRRLTGCPQYASGLCPAAYMDNLIVWDYAKTDFSDRFNEDPTGDKYAQFSIDRVILHFGPEDAGLKDGVKLRGSFVLSDDTDGIDPVTEDVAVTVGNYMLTIPAGSFAINPHGRGYHNVFRGTVDGAKVVAKISEKRLDTYVFDMLIRNIDLASTANPVAIGLAVGNDSGKVEQRLQGVLYKGKGELTR